MVDTHPKDARRHYADHNQHKPPPARTRAAHTGGIQVNMVDYLVVVIAAGKRPASIPNLEAKPASADGTAPGRVWESRTPPQHTFAVGSWNKMFQDPTVLSYPQHDTGRATASHPRLFN